MNKKQLVAAGVIVIAIGGVLFAGGQLWLGTRATYPVSMPVSLAIGTVTTPEFSVNVSQKYDIEIEAKKRIPFDTLCERLGVSVATPRELRDKTAVLKAKWAIRSGGVVVARGSTDDSVGAGFSADTIDRSIGSFTPVVGKKYVMAVTFTRDGSSLAVTDPHLVVHVTPIYYEEEMFLSLFLYMLLAAFGFVGALFIVKAFEYKWIDKLRWRGSDLS